MTLLWILAAAYYLVLIGGALAILVCLVAGPRPWSRRLCKITLWATGLSVFISACAGYRAFGEPWLVETKGSVIPIVWQSGTALWVAACLAAPLGLEFLLLLAAGFWRLRVKTPETA